MNKVIVAAFLSLIVIAVVFCIGVKLWQMDVAKGEIGLATRYDGQFNVVEAALFKMRTVIKNKHTCTDEWADKFLKVVALQAQGRAGMAQAASAEGNPGVSKGNAAVGAVVAGGMGINVSRESEALGIPQELYTQLANAIEGQMADFTRQQDILTDVWREHTAYCKDPYHNWLGVALADKVKSKPEMITSKETKDSVASKQMDEKLM